MPRTLPPVHRMRAERRREHVTQFVGTQVDITYSALRDPDDASTIRGQLVAVAQPLTGAAFDTPQAVVHVGSLAQEAASGRRRGTYSISLATMLTITHTETPR